MALFYGLSPAVCDALLPRPKVRTVDWARERISFPPGSELSGPFRLDYFPHAEEILDCCDNPYYEQVTFQGGTRCSKTVTAQALLGRVADTDPHPMALADADERSTKRVIRRTWKLFSQTRGLRDKLPPERRRSEERIFLPDCEIHGAWSGSAATAADYAAFVVVLNEIDKHSKATSDESDFPNLMMQRASGYYGATVLAISTPTLVKVSRIEALRLAGDNRARYVPCPFCNHYQTLRLGNKDAVGGLKWDHDNHGRSTEKIAADTGYYECEKCRKRIRDEHRKTMFNAGLWVPEGCDIKRGKVTGKKARDVPHASFGPLSTMHSLLPSITWGKVAAEWVKAVHEDRRKGNSEKRRNFVNSWLGETWDPRPRKTRPHEVAERLAGDTPIGLCPPWSVFLTGAADVHGEGNDLIWQICAWGPFARGRLIDYGTCNSWSDFEKLVREAEYKHADGGRALKISRFAIDSGDGHHTETVYEACRRIPGCVPLKGQTGKFAEFMQVSDVNAVPGRTPPKHVPLLGNTLTRFLLYKCNHERSQRWAQALVDGEVTAKHPHFWDLCVEAALDGTLIDQLLAEYPHDETNDDGYTISKWTRTGPNEHRDLARYNRALADLLMQNGRNWERIRRGTTQVEPQTAGGGWFSARKGRR